VPADGTSAERSSIGSMLCLPTAPALPTKASGDFGTSPFYGQRLDKPLLACKPTMGASEAKHKKLIFAKSPPMDFARPPHHYALRDYQKIKALETGGSPYPSFCYGAFLKSGRLLELNLIDWSLLLGRFCEKSNSANAGSPKAAGTHKRYSSRSWRRG
jgi:hypothetical protein